MIRDAEPADIEPLSSVFRRSSLSNDGDRPNLEAHPEVLEFDATCVREGRTRVAVEDNQGVGFTTIAIADGIAELDDLFVDPDWMRRGIGLALMRDVGEVAIARGAHRIEVTANDHAMAFYTRAGFVHDGVEQTRFGPATRMHLDLKPAP